jgi:alcohol dehydrogenase class IV
MMKPFEFATANRIIFGAGKSLQLGDLAAGLGSRALVLLGMPPELASELLESLQDSGVGVEILRIHGEPSLEFIWEGVEKARQADCDLIIGIGGGSTLDTGKAIAALLTNPGEPLDYLEVIGKGQKLHNAPVPFIAVPTTSGTGAEVTRNAVLFSPEHRVKVSLRSPLMLPRLALVDPALTLSLPPDVTARTGLDALTQLIEPYVSIKANPLTDGFCREGIRRAANALRQAYNDGTDLDARTDMSLASLLGGLALANAGLGAVHGLAGVIGGMFNAPHGAVCARLLLFVMLHNIEKLENTEKKHPVSQRYGEIAYLLTGNEGANPREGVLWVSDLCAHMHISPLSTYSMSAKDFPAVIEKTSVSSSMKSNPIQYEHKDYVTVLSQAL